MAKLSCAGRIKFKFYLCLWHPFDLILSLFGFLIWCHVLVGPALWSLSIPFWLPAFLSWKVFKCKVRLHGAGSGWTWLCWGLSMANTPPSSSCSPGVQAVQLKAPRHVVIWGQLRNLNIWYLTWTAMCMVLLCELCHYCTYLVDIFTHCLKL